MSQLLVSQPAIKTNMTTTLQ